MPTRSNPFEHFAGVYDAIYAARGKDYAAEATYVCDTIGEHAARPIETLLDVACGTGEHLRHFAARFVATGVDASPTMLHVARRKLKGVKLSRADMRDLELGRRYDAVTCLFAAVAYLKDEGELRDAVASMARHVNPGGVLVIEPGVTPGELVPVQAQIVEAPMEDGMVRRHAEAERRDDVLLLRFRFETEQDLEGVRIRTEFEEEHRVRLFTHEQYAAALESAGLVFRHLDAWPGPRGLYVGWPRHVPGTSGLEVGRRLGSDGQIEREDPDVEQRDPAHEEEDRVRQHRRDQRADAELAVVAAREGEDQPEVAHHRRDDVRRAVADAVGGLDHLGAVPDRA